MGAGSLIFLLCLYTGRSWMATLLHENTGGTEGSMEEDNTLSESDPEDVNYDIKDK